MNATSEAMADMRTWQRVRHGLSPEREGLVTASLAPKIIHGSSADRYQLWLELTGQAEPEDLSGVFPVQWGKHNEGFVLDWTEKTTQHEITERQRWCRHSQLPIGATLDGYRPFDDAVVEAKVLSPHSQPRTDTGAPGFMDYYAPQVVLQMHCRPAARGYLCVQQGNSPPQMFEVDRNEAYENQVLDQVSLFCSYVTTRTAPSPPPPAPVLPERWRTVDLSAESSENWVHAMRPQLDRWHDTRPGFTQHEQTKADIKALLPDDVGRVTHGPITIRRSKTGAVTITEK